MSQRIDSLNLSYAPTAEVDLVHTVTWFCPYRMQPFIASIMPTLVREWVAEAPGGTMRRDDAHEWFVGFLSRWVSQI